MEPCFCSSVRLLRAARSSHNEYANIYQKICQIEKEICQTFHCEFAKPFTVSPFTVYLILGTKNEFVSNCRSDVMKAFVLYIMDTYFF